MFLGSLGLTHQRAHTPHIHTHIYIYMYIHTHICTHATPTDFKEVEYLSLFMNNGKRPKRVVLQQLISDLTAVSHAAGVSVCMCVSVCVCVCACVCVLVFRVYATSS
jgi:hypothetical protein